MWKGYQAFKLYPSANFDSSLYLVRRGIARNYKWKGQICIFRRFSSIYTEYSTLYNVVLNVPPTEKRSFPYKTTTIIIIYSDIYTYIQ